MVSKYKKLSRNTILFVINSFGSRIITFLLLPLYTYILSTNDYGTIDLVTSTVQLMIPIFTLNIQDAVLRFALDEKYDSKEVLTVGIRINFIGLLFVIVGVFLIKSTSIVNIDSNYLLFFVFSYFFGAMYNTISMYIRAIDEVGILVISGITNTVISCGLNIVLLIVVKLGVNGYLIANTVGTLVAIIIMVSKGKLINSLTWVRNSSLKYEMIIYSAPLIMNSIAWWINNVSDKYIVSFFCGVAINGIYSIAYKIPTILSTLQAIFYNSWSISAITEFDENDKDGFITNVYMLYTFVSIVGCSIIMILNKPLANILYSNDFYVAWKYVPFLLLGTTFNGIALFIGCLFSAVMKTNDIAKTTIYGAIINTILNFVLIPIIGAVGASFATMFGYLMIWICRVVKIRNIVNISVDWKQQALVFIILFIQSIIAVFDLNIILQILVFVILVILQRKYLIMLLNKAIEILKNKLKR